MANYALDTPQTVEAGLTVNDLVRVLRRRRSVGLIILGTCFSLTLLYCIVATKRYTAVAVVQVQKEGSTPIDLSDLGAPAVGLGGDVAASTLNLETQSQILQSDTLALNVIRDLNLEATPDFKSHWNPIGAVLGLFAPAGKPDPQGVPLEDSPRRRDRAIRKFEKNLQVKVITGTRLIHVSYSDPDPRLSAAIANRLVQGLTDFSSESRTASSSQASDFLQGKLADLRKQSEDDQARLATLQKGADTVSHAALKDEAVNYTLQRDEANQSRTLYEHLSKKLKEAGVLKGLKGGDLSIVDPARVPANSSKPNTLLLLAASIAVGLLFAVGGMLLAEGLDHSIHSTAQIEQMGLPLLGILPRYGKGPTATEGMRNLRTLSAPRSAYSEAVRGIRNSLVMVGLTQHRVIVVTSANAHEGKSITARNLAVSVAQQGKRVVLVDADFRSTADGGPEFTAKEGLSTLLSGPPVAPALLEVPTQPNLFILPRGTTPPNPAELLSSPRMNLLVEELKQQFELVLIDCPPVLPVVDAAIVSSMADSTVLVAHQGVTEQASLARAYQILATNAKPDSIAVVLNEVSPGSDLYRSYFGKTTAHYYQEDAHETA
jgi:capsular exopolysaccharide synthesis family protein